MVTDDGCSRSFWTDRASVFVRRVRAQTGNLKYACSQIQKRLFCGEPKRLQCPLLFVKEPRNQTGDDFQLQYTFWEEHTHSPTAVDINLAQLLSSQQFGF